MEQKTQWTDEWKRHYEMYSDMHQEIETVSGIGELPLKLNLEVTEESQVKPIVISPIHYERGTFYTLEDKCNCRNPEKAVSAKHLRKR